MFIESYKLFAATSLKISESRKRKINWYKTNIYSASSEDVVLLSRSFFFLLNMEKPPVGNTATPPTGFYQIIQSYFETLKSSSYKYIESILENSLTLGFTFGFSSKLLFFSAS